MDIDGMDGEGCQSLIDSNGEAMVAAVHRV